MNSDHNKITMRLETVEKRVDAALKVFLANDFALLEINVNERTISHKFAEYLQVVFKDWNVDCEYNREGHECDPKIISLPRIDDDSEESKSISVYPDIIIHQRKKKQNLLIIEIKKSSNKNHKAKEFDKLKLKTYLSDLKYAYGLFLTFNTDTPTETGENYTLEWQ